MILRDIHASLLRFCADFSERYPGMAVENFDAHADESTIPKSDIVGLSGLSIALDDSFVSTKLMIGISTLDDMNLFRLMDRMDVLLDRLKPTQRLPVYDADTGIEKGWMIVENGTTLMPVGGSKARPLQYILISLATNLSFNLRT